MILNDKGFDGRIYENDYNNPTYVDLIEEVGEKSYRLGTEMREDIFLLRYTAEQRKALNTKKESKFNLRTNTMETFVRIFDDVDGVERFELYSNQSIQKRKKAHDDEIADEQEADETFQDGAQDVVGCAVAHRNALTKADVGYVEQQRSDKFDGKEKKKLKKNDSSVSTATSGSSSNSFRMISGKVKKHNQKGTKDKKKTGAAKSAAKGTPGNLVASAAPDQASGAGGTSLGADTISGFALDKPTEKKQQTFVRQIDMKLREGKQILDQLINADDSSKIKEEEFVGNIRKLCGVETKVLANNLVKCKADGH